MVVVFILPRLVVEAAQQQPRASPVRHDIRHGGTTVVRRRWQAGQMPIVDESALPPPYDPGVRTPVLATKLFAPARRPQLVARPRLMGQLDRTLDANNRLTLVSAPAGFGKTTLLSGWLTDLESRGTDARIGWLSLDEDDNDLSRLLTHVIAALHGAGLDVDHSTLEDHQGSSPSSALTAIVNDVARAVDAVPATHWVLVLDDVHVISGSDVREAMSFLLDHLPRRLHLLMATRSDPPLPLALLRGRGELTELRAADLRFTRLEAVEFLNRVMGLHLSVDDVAALEARTEGWIAGLQLAALSLRGHARDEAVTDFIDAFAGQQPLRHRLPGRRSAGASVRRHPRLPAAHLHPRPP
jgi:LuxR family maltose regulon positive regulatory protein